MTNIKESMIKNMERETENRIKAQRDIYLLHRAPHGDGDSKYALYQSILDKWNNMDFREKKIRTLMMHLYDKRIHVDYLNYKLIVSPLTIGKNVGYAISLENNGLGFFVRVKMDESYFLVDGISKKILPNYNDYITDFLDYYKKDVLHMRGEKSVESNGERILCGS